MPLPRLVWVRMLASWILAIWKGMSTGIVQFVRACVPFEVLVVPIRPVPHWLMIAALACVNRVQAPEAASSCGSTDGCAIVNPSPKWLDIPRKIKNGYLYLFADVSRDGEMIRANQVSMNPALRDRREARLHPLRRKATVRLFAGMAITRSNWKPVAASATSSNRRRPHSGLRALRLASKSRLLAAVSTPAWMNGP